MIDNWKRELIVYFVLPILFIFVAGFLTGFWIGWKVGVLDMKEAMDGEAKTYQVP